MPNVGTVGETGRRAIKVLMNESWLPMLWEFIKKGGSESRSGKFSTLRYKQLRKLMTFTKKHPKYLPKVVSGKHPVGSFVKQHPIGTGAAAGITGAKALDWLITPGVALSDLSPADRYAIYGALAGAPAGGVTGYLAADSLGMNPWLATGLGGVAGAGLGAAAGWGIGRYI